MTSYKLTQRIRLEIGCTLKLLSETLTEEQTKALLKCLANIETLVDDLYFEARNLESEKVLRLKPPTMDYSAALELYEKDQYFFPANAWKGGLKNG